MPQSNGLAESPLGAEAVLGRVSLFKMLAGEEMAELADNSTFRRVTAGIALARPGKIERFNCWGAGGRSLVAAEAALLQRKSRAPWRSAASSAATEESR